jgi:hypothetical protein
MNTILLTALGAAALLPAAPPAAPVAVSSAEVQPLTGTILVLKNERTVEGDIERIAGRYRVRRPVGETWVDGSQVQRLCANPAEAYTVLRNLITRADDADRLARVAEWALDHGLNRQALADTKAALAVNANHAQGRRLLARLDPRQAPGAAETVAPAPPLPAPPPAPRLDLTAEALNQFGTRVQPILMNACAGCHNDTRGTAFRLTRADEIGVANRKTLQQNVTAVLAFVNVAQPLASPFLTKAMSVHWPLVNPADGSQPPFKNRHAPAFRALEDWVRLALTTSPQVGEIQPVAADASRNVSVPPIEPRTVPVVPSKTEPSPAVPPELLAPPPPVSNTGRPAPDVCDPDDFNRRNHPDRTKPADAPKR